MREGKQLLLEEIREKIESSNGFVLASYSALNSQVNRELRNKIAEFNGDLEIVRKRLFVKALEVGGTSLEGISLEGHIGVFFAKDEPLELLKAAVNFSKDYKDNLKIMGGLIDNEVVNAVDIQVLATLPSLKELRGQFVGLIEAPMAQTVSTVQSMLTSLLYCIEAKSNKSE